MEINIQQKAPIWDQLVAHFAKKSISFHTPGHKSGLGLDPEWLTLAGTSLAQFDLTEIPGLDNLHFPQGVILEAQKLAALACGARQSFFLVNGASCGIQAMVLASCKPGDKLIIPRDCHISVHNALIMAGVEPIYIYPEVNKAGIILGVTREHLRKALQTNPAAKAVLLINPNYYGICSDLLSLAQEVKAFDKLLLVDEAHGAHLPFHQQLPLSAAQVGADLWVQSTHKMSSSLTQTALLHVGSEIVNLEKITNSLRLVQSTSPSYLLLASLDLARRQMAVQGQALMDQLIRWSAEVRDKLVGIEGINCFDEQALPMGLGFSMDPLKLLIDFTGIGLSGQKAAQLLSAEYQLVAEMADNQQVLFLLGPGTGQEDLQQLLNACVDLKKHQGLHQDIALNKDCSNFMSNQNKIYDFSSSWESVRQVLSPRAAWFAQSQEKPVSEVVGKIAGQFVTPYPPGIPILCPGEEITAEKAAVISQIVSHIKIVDKYVRMIN